MCKGVLYLCNVNQIHGILERVMEIHYSITNSALVLDDRNVMLTYGITATNENGETVSEFSDVSVNREFTEKIVDLLNFCKIEPCHFFDVVLDELNR